MHSPCTRLPDSLVKTLLSPYYSPPMEVTETSQDSSCPPTPPHMFNVMTQFPNAPSERGVFLAHPNNSLSNELGLLTFTAQTKLVSFALCSPSSPSQNDPPLFKPSSMALDVHSLQEQFPNCSSSRGCLLFQNFYHNPSKLSKDLFSNCFMYVHLVSQGGCSSTKAETIFPSHVFNINDSV